MMTRLVLKIYDLMAERRRMCLLSFLMTTALLAAMVMRLDFKEDISDFLPLDASQQKQLQMYQDVAGANRIVAIFEQRDTAHRNPDFIVEAIRRFVETVESRPTITMIAEADFSQAEQTAHFVYNNIPYFLLPADYRRMDSLLNEPGYMARQLQADREMLLFPVGGQLSENIQRDPLNLFTPVVATLSQSSDFSYELYEGCIFAPDMSRAFVLIDSPYGSSETEHNARLLDFLQACADSSLVSPNSSLASEAVSIRFTGGPVVAVGNAAQIKADSLLSVSLAVVLILLLLFYSLRRVRRLVLIAVAIGWGWLFALALLSLVHREVSVIVVGISSVILGIAVNYPLHLMAHLSHTPDVRTALREIAKPLVVGNVTTVGAFLALVPLQSLALRDLGLFSAFLLVGTILFVLLWLPHWVGGNQSDRSLDCGSAANQGPVPAISDVFSRLVTFSPDRKSWLVVLIVLLTFFFGYHSTGISFDTDLNHINYMTAEQKADMTMLNGNHADSRFLLSDSTQQQRLQLWHEWLGRHPGLAASLRAEAPKAGFSEGSFDDFTAILTADFQPRPLDYFRPLPPTLLLQNIDVKGLNSTLLRQLSDNFNYIGLACGAIVFFFLWLSFRSLALAMLSFLPMAVSWVWILGIMAIGGIQFNIVNIILATFIFGQGDDYTIFMTEGAVYEAVHRRPMLASYKRTIILSALIMFIGIGSLIVARHPALHSLAEVTIVGMSSVVLMAFVLPPLIFRWLVRYRRIFKKRKQS